MVFEILQITQYRFSIKWRTAPFLGRISKENFRSTSTKVFKLNLDEILEFESKDLDNNEKCKYMIKVWFDNSLLTLSEHSQGNWLDSVSGSVPEVKNEAALLWTSKEWISGAPKSLWNFISKGLYKPSLFPWHASHFRWIKSVKHYLTFSIFFSPEIRPKPSGHSHRTSSVCRVARYPKWTWRDVCLSSVQ